ncbi:MAG: type VI secretion system baseplate subunit TssG [Rhodobacteraceae bacterium]|nr:type VI secretion system baseplate subunit TssG [Paracoccaceae bacterium]QEW19751.1 type VI secretion protein, family [Marinibacterium anthonyi]
MATGQRPGPDHLSRDHRASDDPSLFDRLVEKPQEHHLFQALRVIEAHYSDAPRLGESRRPREDRVRLGQEAELAFPPSTIASYKKGEHGKPDKLTNRFFGLFGPHGPLPLHMTEYARDRRRNHRDWTLQAFADTLTHRMMCLFYRAWATGQPAPNYDRTDSEDKVAAKVAALGGFHGDAMHDRDAIPGLGRLGFTGHMSQGPRNAEGLLSILSAYFEVPVRIEEFIGSWLTLEPDDQWQLGRPAALGQNTSIGSRVWSRNSKFRIRIGPLAKTDYERLLPGGAALDRMTSIVRSYVGDALEWDIHMILKGDEVPRTSLGGSTRLGLLSWTGAKPDPDDTRPDAEDLYIYPRLGPGPYFAD